MNSHDRDTPPDFPHARWLGAAALTVAVAIAAPAYSAELAVSAQEIGSRATAAYPDHAPPPPPQSLDLKAGDYQWTPEISPAGPLVVVVSLPAQRAHVYRNGIRIGVSTISSGKPGHETPTGVFPILQKREEHYSNLYDNAPMPYMQRLTWDGIALHAGRIPGQPASHGCIRLPKAFAKALFSVTERGVNVVVADEASHGPSVVWATDRVPVDYYTGLERAQMPRIGEREDGRYGGEPMVTLD